MTTSYELSLRLKEFGSPQVGGEYYWVSPDKVVYKNGLFVDPSKFLCRAFTLGELVRELGEFTLERAISGYYATQNELRYVSTSTPEEAAGELLAAIKEQGLKQKQS